MNTVLLYLLESSVYLLVLGLVYKWLLSRQTHFTWMRAFLLSLVVASLVLPLLPTPATWFSKLINPEIVEPAVSNPIFTLNWLTPSSVLNSPTATSETASLISLPLLLLVVYSVGFSYRLLVFGVNLTKIRKSIVCSTKRREGNYWLVNLSHKEPTFSFLNYVFISSQSTFTPAEYQQVLQHELVHVRQRHTLDLLLFELTHILLWFHPVIPYLKKQLREVHEYLADQAVAKKPEEQRDYAHLLLKLASEDRPLSLATSFFGKQVGRRIAMLTKPRSHPKQRWFFASIIPLCASIFLLSACLEEPTNNASSISSSPNQAVEKSDNMRTIGQIRWEGNTVYSDEFLTEALGLQSGDPYDSAEMNQRLNYSADGSDMASLYMDQGYLFFRVDVQEVELAKNKVDLVLSIYEGEVIKISEIHILGNQDIAEETILEEITIKPGELFNRSKLVESQKAIADMGYFDSEQVGINPIPDPENKEVTIEFILKPKAE
ncbi:M56 family metallopeptidase [Tunicatimonas pelagia]|uniref:M56 family metallopeptidase n=1 Tax=Tunicatimonas pelagia TaxID=931531 RepID=UPI0026654E11|nr:M56 family metallopeptidase [Tunicatimonas pelagia]WKN43527.1 POTRA domain-containing protein [Tunicatimonas pelagia]